MAEEPFRPEDVESLRVDTTPPVAARFGRVRARTFLDMEFSTPLTLALALTFGAANATENGAAPLLRREVADKLALSEHDIDRVAGILERNNILLPAEHPKTAAPGYVLARCATALTIADVLNACLDDAPGENLLQRTNKLAPINPILKRINQALSQALNGHFSDSIAKVLQRSRQEAASTPDK